MLHSLDDEKLLIHEKRVDLARELDLETQKRVDTEHNFEQLREEFLKMELEDARIRSEMQSRIDQLESEKQNLQLKLVRVADQFEKGDVSSKERQLTYEEMLQESKRAYMQLDDNYKALVEKLQNEKNNAIKQFEKTYQSKIKCNFITTFTFFSFGRDSETLETVVGRSEERDRCFRISKNRLKTGIRQLTVQFREKKAK